MNTASYHFGVSLMMRTSLKEGNRRARGLYESEGFVREGVLRDSLWTGEVHETLVVMSILESEYRA